MRLRIGDPFPVPQGFELIPLRLTGLPALDAQRDEGIVLTKRQRIIYFDPAALVDLIVPVRIDIRGVMIILIVGTANGIGAAILKQEHAVLWGLIEHDLVDEISGTARDRLLQKGVFPHNPLHSHAPCSDVYELLEEQIFHGVGNKNLDVLPAGVIPPNPSELISREQLDRAINHLREHYDYVLLDTPPVGLVSDTLSIGRTADITMFVCRADYTPRSSFELINSLKEEEKLPNVNLVLNGMDLKKKKYGYYYGYGKYGKYGKYGRYGYGKYGKYGIYGHYGKSDGGTEHTEK